MPSLADIRARLIEQANKSKTKGSGDNGVYAHWNINDDETAILRFLEDGDAENPFFWIERAVFKFPFNGLKGSTKHNILDSDKEVTVQVPCMEMYGEKDEILDEVRTWFKDPSLEDMGRKYWKKRSYLFQGFVRQDPMDGSKDYEVPENLIRRFNISPQIFKLIKNSLLDPDIENLPCDQELGLDFRITKGQKGGYADYATSSWSRKETALTDVERAAIEEHGLFNLVEFLPKKPDAIALGLIREMFEASVEGEPYDIEKWGTLYTPYGMSRVDTSNNDEAKTDAPQEAKAPVKPKVTPKVTPKVEPKVEAVAEKVEAVETSVETATAVIESPVEAPAEEAAPTANINAQDILAKIRSRQQ